MAEITIQLRKVKKLTVQTLFPSTLCLLPTPTENADAQERRYRFAIENCLLALVMQKILSILDIIKNRKLLTLVVFTIIIAAAVVVHTRLWSYDTQAETEDIYYIWIEGKRLLLGENPYARILSGNMRENSKYATYFPLFYLFSYLTQLLGWKEYSNWIDLWRHIFLLFNLGIAALIFYTFYQNRLFIFAIFSSSFWLFNRWTLYVTMIAHIEFIPIFFLITSLILFRRNKYTSLILFSLSLALKQIAVFLLPLYLIWVWQSVESKKTKETLISFGVILSIPFLTSLPFIFWNQEGLIKSILFSATRNPGGHFNAPSLDALIMNAVPNFVGIKAKLPMLFLMALIYLSVIQRKLGMYTSSLITMFIFIDFNSVLFGQYFCWTIPLLSLAICDFVNPNQHTLRTEELDSTN